MPERRGRELVMIMLHDPGHLNEVLAALLEAGVVNATAVEAQGMGRLLSRDMPIFASFRHLFAGSKPYTYTVFAPVENGEVTDEIIELVRDALADVEPEDRGFVFSLPIGTFADLSEAP